MSKLDLNHIDDVHFDVLKEIGNIGAGNATTALSQMINKRVDMKVPKVELLDFNELANIVGGPENLVVCKNKVFIILIISSFSYY